MSSRTPLTLIALAVLALAGSCGRPDTPPAAPSAAKEEIRPATIVAAVDHAKVDVGDTVKYTVTTRAKPGFKFDLPATFENIPVFLDYTRWDQKTREDGVVEATRTVTIDPGIGPYCVIPPLTLHFTDPAGKPGEAHTEEITIEVKSRLAAGEAIPDIKERVEVVLPPPPKKPETVSTWIVAAGLAAIVLGVAAFWWFRRRRATLAPPPRPPWELALEALATLRADNLLAQGRVEEFYVRLSGIVRAYIERRFGVMAPEMTTEEFLARAKQVSALLPEHRALLGEFLTASDLVKFARYVPGADEAGGALGAAETFVRDTKPALTEAAR